MNESNEFYREEIARILSGIEDNDILKYVYVIVSDIEGGKMKNRKKINWALIILIYFLGLLTNYFLR